MELHNRHPPRFICKYKIYFIFYIKNNNPWEFPMDYILYLYVRIIKSSNGLVLFFSKSTTPAENHNMTVSIITLIIISLYLSIILTILHYKFLQSLKINNLRQSDSQRRAERSPSQSHQTCPS